MKPIRLIVNWGIVILSPLWILPFLIIMLVIGFIKTIKLMPIIVCIFTLGIIMGYVIFGLK